MPTLTLIVQIFGWIVLAFVCLILFIIVVGAMLDDSILEPEPYTCTECGSPKDEFLVCKFCERRDPHGAPL